MDPTSTVKNLLAAMKDKAAKVQEYLDIMDVFFFEGQKATNEEQAHDVNVNRKINHAHVNLFVGG